MEVLETAVYAEDLEKARAFYEGVLGLPCFQYQPPRHAFFRAGKGVFLVFIPFYANSFVLGHQWNRVCRLRVSGSWARTRHRSATASIISSR
ncbi:VOC family protein, partial [Thermus scotoductus]|uniref:VOC family protein n=1 Tax=Thermus scotoductus TaxID=37636 RepID=UPI0020A2AF83